MSDAHTSPTPAAISAPDARTVALITLLPGKVRVSRAMVKGLYPWRVSVELPRGWEFETLEQDRNCHTWGVRTKARADEFRALIIAGIAARMIVGNAHVSPMIAFPCLRFIGYGD